MAVIAHQWIGVSDAGLAEVCAAMGVEKPVWLSTDALVDEGTSTSRDVRAEMAERGLVRCVDGEWFVHPVLDRLIAVSSEPAMVGVAISISDHVVVTKAILGETGAAVVRRTDGRVEFEVMLIEPVEFAPALLRACDLPDRAASTPHGSMVHRPNLGDAASAEERLVADLQSVGAAVSGVLGETRSANQITVIALMPSGSRSATSTWIVAGDGAGAEISVIARDQLTFEPLDGPAVRDGLKAALMSMGEGASSR